MNTTKVIQNVNQKVITFIKAEIANKKERHKKIMESINPSVISHLKHMKKIG